MPWGQEHAYTHIRVIGSILKPVQARDMVNRCSCKLNVWAVRVPCYSESQGQVWSRAQTIVAEENLAP